MFTSNNNVSARGVVAFVDGKIVGGDSQYYYTGVYSEDGNKISGQFFVTCYLDSGPLPNAFWSSFSLGLTLEGPVVNGDSVAEELKIDACVASEPARRIRIELVRVSTL
jgi:hypothetical protein